MEKMETINNLLADGLKDFRQAITEGQQGARTYNKKSEYVYEPEAARFKLAVYFKDGNKRYFSSLRLKARIKNRCLSSNTSRSVSRSFKLSRRSLKNLLSFGLVPGYKKAVW
mgnify:CR=1 FL=1